MFPYMNQFGFDFFFLRMKCKKNCFVIKNYVVARNSQIEDMRGEAQGRHLLSLRLGAFWEVPRAFCDRSDKTRQRGRHLGRHLRCPSSCHCVRLNVIYMEFFVFVNLFIWFEFTKEWLIQNCLWQKYTLLWLYSSGSNIVMGLLRGRKWIEFPSNNHNSTFCKFHLLPFLLLTLSPFHC